MAAVDAVPEQHLEFFEDPVQAAVSVIVVTASRDHGDWFYEDVGEMPFKLAA